MSYARGTIALARTADFNSYGVQFFVTTVPTPKLEGLFTALGHVVSGMNVVDQIQEGDLILSSRLQK
jgi:peptidylprolyl isomerase